MSENKELTITEADNLLREYYTKNKDGKGGGYAQRLLRQLVNQERNPPLSPQLNAGEVGGKVLQANKSIYIASKTIHAETWKSLRDDADVNIISSWINEAGKEESSDLVDLSRRCVSECIEADALIIYRYPEEYLKGAFIEMGIGLAHNKPIFLVGPVLPEGSVFTKPDNVHQCESIEEAVFRITGEKIKEVKSLETEAPVSDGKTCICSAPEHCDGSCYSMPPVERYLAAEESQEAVPVRQGDSEICWAEWSLGDAIKAFKALQQERDQYKERWDRSEANITALTEQLGVVQGEREELSAALYKLKDNGLDYDEVDILLKKYQKQ